MWFLQYLGKGRWTRNEDDESTEHTPVNKQSVVLARKRPGKSLSTQESTTPTQLVFTTESIDNR